MSVLSGTFTKILNSDNFWSAMVTWSMHGVFFFLNFYID